MQIAVALLMEQHALQMQIAVVLLMEQYVLQMQIVVVLLMEQHVLQDQIAVGFGTGLHGLVQIAVVLLKTELPG